uniref:Uncharacterized protein n=1 Tax=Panagrolaimus sp. ES5 TaxID=591445 RepID=A0AC34G998_9BILA
KEEKEAPYLVDEGSSPTLAENIAAYEESDDPPDTDRVVEAVLPPSEKVQFRASKPTKDLNKLPSSSSCCSAIAATRRAAAKTAGNAAKSPAKEADQFGQV